MFIRSLSEGTGNTPLLELCNIEKKLSLKARILAKCEFMNPTGSAKDRAALYMIKDFIARGLLCPGGTVCEATSGNTGIGLASVCAQMGIRAVIIMTDTMSEERIKLMKAYGAEVWLSDGSRGMAGSLEMVEKVKEKYPGCVEAGQFVNSANSLSHYETTGPEIWRDTDGDIAVFTCGVGTGGTFSGTGKYLREKDPSVKLIAMEPASSPLLSGGKAGSHKLQGIGANFVPKVLDTSLIDEVITVTDDEAYEFTAMLGKYEGVLAGISAGAAAAAAVKIAGRPEYCGKNIVTVLPDSGDRYLSSGVF